MRSYEKKIIIFEYDIPSIKKLLENQNFDIFSKNKLQKIRLNLTTTLNVTYSLHLFRG